MREHRQPRGFVHFRLEHMPALVALLAHLAGVTGIACAVVVITAGMPTGANAFMLARRFGTLIEASAGTAVSLATLTVLLGLLR